MCLGSAGEVRASAHRRCQAISLTRWTALTSRSSAGILRACAERRNGVRFPSAPPYVQKRTPLCPKELHFLVLGLASVGTRSDDDTRLNICSLRWYGGEPQVAVLVLYNMLHLESRQALPWRTSVPLFSHLVGPTARLITQL